jgi:hypothetical protein
MNEDVPSGTTEVRENPIAQWQITSMGHLYMGYVWQDDPSDLAKFMRWLVSRDPYNARGELIITRMSPR